jgi:hypothetical protein
MKKDAHQHDPQLVRSGYDRAAGGYAAERDRFSESNVTGPIHRSPKAGGNRP